MLEGGCHLAEDQRELMDDDVEDLLAVRDELKNRRSLVHLLYWPFKPNNAQPINNNRTNSFNYVDVDPINITYDCSVVICMRNLALMKAFGPKRLPFI